MEEISTIEIQILSKEYIESITHKKSWAYYFFKRLFAIVVSFLAIIILSPLMIIVALLVKITSKGPVFFKDVRIGKNGKHIKILKFRSMYFDAEKNIKNYVDENQYHEWKKERKIKDDPRVTKFGRFIRKTAIDEIPQLFNILKGDIAFVGPRPITTSEYNNYSKNEIQLITSTRPGLTGYWQVYNQRKSTFNNGTRQKMDIDYFERRSLWFDFKLIILTIPSLIKRGGAD